MQILQKRGFERVYKKLHAAQRASVDDALRAIISNPALGDAKVGDLAGIFVYKFKMTGQLMLLAYELRDHNLTLVLLALGSHENFYRDLKG